MRIGLFSDTYLPEINGVATSVHILREALEASGHTVFVITTKPKEYEEDKEVLRLSGLELKKLYGYVLTSPIHLNAYNQIKEMKLDIIHVHTEFSVGIFARIVAKMQELPLVSTYHTTYEDYTHYINFAHLDVVDKIAKKAVSKISRLYVDSSSAVISPSEKTKKMLETYKVRKTIYVVPTGLPLHRFSQDNEKDKRAKKIREALGVNDKECLIVYLGRLAQEKSIDILIDGIHELKKRNKPCKLLIVGAGPSEEKLKEQASMLGVSQEVIFAGKKIAEEVPDYYEAADCFASASTTETQGLTYIEALASGLAIFARPDEILKGLLVESETGYYFSDESTFADKMELFLNIPEQEKEKIKSKAREKVEPYNIERFAEKITQVYKSAIAQNKELYQIEKIQTKNDYVQLTLSISSAQPIKILMDIDVYFEMGYRKGHYLTAEEVADLIEMEEAVKAYQMCLRKLSVKDRSRKEMYDWLTQNTKLGIEDINKIIERLEKSNFIDDYRYTKESVFNLKGALSGEKKIFNILRKKGITPDMINEVLESSRNDNEEYNNALKWAKKTQGTIRDKSVKMRKQVLFQKLVNQGYSGEVLSRVMMDIDFEKDERDEMEVLRKVAGKCKKRNERKYQGTQLRNVVYRYCATQGFDVEDIYVILDEMRWDDDKD